MKNRYYQILFLSFVLITVLAFNFSAGAAEPKRIALLPFKINAEKDMSFLQNGIFDMLTSRLSKENEVVVLSRQKAEDALKAVAGAGTLNESLARKIGSRLSTDYTLFGSLTILGNSISIDAKMVDVSAETPTMSFFDQSRDLGGVITKINHMAAEINENIFGRQAAVAQKKAPKPQAPKPAPTDDAQAHPEKLLRGKGAAEGGSPFIMMEEAEKQPQFQKFWRSASFKHLINGIALGDVDRDGKIETVVVTPHSVIIYRAEGGRFYKAHEVKGSKSRYNIGVDVADINENGVAEIFVTGLNATRLSLNSAVYEYDGKNYREIVENSRWYFRVADHPNRGKILLGQRHRVYQPFSGGIYDMIWQNSEYVPEKAINTPKKISLMGFTLGDVLNDKQDTSLAYKENDHIQIIDPDGKEMWRSAERYGGSTLYSVGEKQRRGEIQNPIYYPMRLLVTDANGDGANEVIVVKNYDVAKMKLEKLRIFNSAHIESLAWDGLGLQTNWKTRKISGSIRDYALGDFDNDGKIELIAAVILNEGRVVLVTEPKTTIIAYELPS